MDKNVFKNITYGLYVVTSKYNDILSGCIVNTVSQITSVDPVVAISINKNNYMNEIIKKSNIVAISILDVNTNKDLISKFGYKSSKDIDKFTDTSYELIDEVPVVKENTNGYIIGKVINIIDVNTHDIFLVSVSKSALLNGEDSLTYKDYQLKMKGTSPKNAPTYIETETNKTDSNKYRCIICGHIYDDGVEEIPFHLLPDDWVCPVCGVSKDKFEKIN